MNLDYNHHQPIYKNHFQEYIDKFADIFKIAGIKSVTVVVMEVPCCSGLPMIVKKGMEAAGRNIPIEDLVISTRGKILR